MGGEARGGDGEAWGGGFWAMAWNGSVQVGQSRGGNGGLLLRLSEHTEAEVEPNRVRGERSALWQP
jgi:hypothetical protein